jgi:hypothetical protein
VWACRINNILVTIFSVVTIPLQLVTTFVDGCLVSCTFGLLLLPMDAIWLVFMGLLLGTSWLWERTAILGWLALLVRIPLALIGLPIALLAEVSSAHRRLPLTAGSTYGRMVMDISS